MTLPLSVLDLAPVGTGFNAARALANSVELARHAERLGYVRYWLAEHHGTPSIASSSPEVLIEHVASRTERIRIGAGGIMLPNHAPLRIAEAFHTLEVLHPGRIDLGLGRAPGTNQATSRALRPFDAERFPSQVQELLALSRGELPSDHPFHSVRVIPSDVELPPVWLLGSSGATARWAGSMSLGYGFAAHFSAAPAAPALQAYREAFGPSDRFPRSHAILAVSVVCAESEARADRLALSMDLAWVRLRRGELAPLPTPEEAAAYPYAPHERAVARSFRSLLVSGTPDRVAQRISALAGEAGADEVMVSSMIHDHDARMSSYELLAEAMPRTAHASEDGATTTAGR